jgi:hypothetical protein
VALPGAAALDAGTTAAGLLAAVLLLAELRPLAELLLCLLLLAPLPELLGLLLLLVALLISPSSSSTLKGFLRQPSKAQSEVSTVEQHRGLMLGPSRRSHAKVRCGFSKYRARNKSREGKQHSDQVARPAVAGLPSAACNV